MASTLCYRYKTENSSLRIEFYENWLQGVMTWLWADFGRGLLRVEAEAEFSLPHADVIVRSFGIENGRLVVGTDGIASLIFIAPFNNANAAGQVCDFPFLRP